MKTSIFLIALLMLAVPFSVLSVLPPTEFGVLTNHAQSTISITNRQNEIKAGEPVRLLMRFKNVTTNETIIVDRKNDIETTSSYDFVVISPSGNDISPKPIIFNTGSGTSHRLAPGGEDQFEYDLSKRCKFDEIGTYKIIAKSHLGLLERGARFVSVSNPLYIKITR